MASKKVVGKLAFSTSRPRAEILHKLLQASYLMVLGLNDSLIYNVFLRRRFRCSAQSSSQEQLVVMHRQPWRPEYF